MAKAASQLQPALPALTIGPELWDAIGRLSTATFVQLRDEVLRLAGAIAWHEGERATEIVALIAGHEVRFRVEREPLAVRLLALVRC